MLDRTISNSPWHAGEIALQASIGVQDRMAEIGPRVIRDHLIEQHRLFYPLLPMVVLGSVDAEGAPWATVRTGYPGFLHASDEHHLHLDLARDPLDPAESGMEHGAAIGLLGIDLDTRRRNRLNGEVIRERSGFSLRVRQSFGNCPKYIQRRGVSFVGDATIPSEVTPIVTDELSEEALRIVRSADTFFVASYVDHHGHGRQVDVSHRGGGAGFVAIDGDWLVIPDYAGNQFFNTLGNIVANPRAGLAFVDFDNGDLLQMTGEAELMDGVASGVPGVERHWRFRPRQTVWRPGVVPLRWEFREWSPFLPDAERLRGNISHA